MEYNLELSDVSLNEQARDMINIRVGMALSRFATLISDFDIVLSKDSTNKKNTSKPKHQDDQGPLICKIKITLQAGHQIEVEDTGPDLDAGFSQAIVRSKRAIERHLKHHRGPRLGASMSSRT
jgi:ribosome-associated translation inhibitor RaiA